MTQDTKNFMQLALEDAQIAARNGEIPVGAVVVGPAGQILARAGNETLSRKDPSGHAEIIALRRAAEKIGDARLIDCDLYATLEPCAMCAGAISHARIRRLYFGAYDPKGGGVEHGARVFSHATCHHAPEVIGGIHEQACGDLLREFFLGKRD